MVARAAKALPIREIREIRGCRNKSAESAKSAVLLLASVFCLRQTQVFTNEPFYLEDLGRFAEFDYVELKVLAKRFLIPNRR